jgi:hypothetical protein
LVPVFIAVAVVAVAVVAVVVVLGSRSRRSRDGVDSFRRQIDALSPEARRPVIDQVHNAAGRADTEPTSTDDAPSGQAPPDDADQDDAHGA